MQTIIRYGQVVLLALGTFMISCERNDKAFDQAIAKHRGSLVDQVNSVGEGAPFFTVETLNPIWQISEQTPIVMMPKFKLIDQNEQQRGTDMFQGKISFVGFFFANCSGFCPFLIEGMKGIEQEVAGLSELIQFVALTVNPEEDTPERLRKFARHKEVPIDKSWTLLTGDRNTIYSLAKVTFASQAFRRQTAEPNFVHSEHVYVLDAKGRLRGVLNGTRTDLSRDAKDLVHKLLKEPGMLELARR